MLIDTKNAAIDLAQWRLANEAAKAGISCLDPSLFCPGECKRDAHYLPQHPATFSSLPRRLEL